MTSNNCNDKHTSLRPRLSAECCNRLRKNRVRKENLTKAKSRELLKEAIYFGLRAHLMSVERLKPANTQTCFAEILRSASRDPSERHLLPQERLRSLTRHQNAAIHVMEQQTGRYRRSAVRMFQAPWTLQANGEPSFKAPPEPHISGKARDNAWLTQM